MKSLKGLVLRYIWKNKLRTIMTIISVMISAFIIFGIFSFGMNFFYNKKINHYKQSGSYDAAYMVNKETAAEMLKLKNGEASDISDDGCEIKKFYVSTNKNGIIYVDDMSYFKGMDLITGHFPTNDNEIITPLHMIGNTDFFATPNASVGENVEIINMVTEGISEEEYEALEEEQREKLLTAQLERIKETNKERYDKIINEADPPYCMPTDFVKLSNEDEQILADLYNRYHKNEGFSKILSGEFNTIEIITNDEGEVINENQMPGLMVNLVTDWEERSVGKQYFAISDFSISLLNLDNLDTSEYRIIVSFKDKKNLSDQAELLGSRLGCPPEFSEAAIDLYEPSMIMEIDEGELFFNALMLMTAAIFGLVVMVIIRNSFNISVCERENDYGMFRCIGLTRKQIIKMVLLEALIIGIIGTILGVFLGILGCKGLFSFLNEYGPRNTVLKEILLEIGTLNFYFRWKAFGLTVLFMAVIVGYSMVSPIEKLYKMSPADSLRSKDDVDKRVSEKLLKKKRKSRTKSGLMGYPVWYGFKNVRIRRGRFLLLVISLAVSFSIVLLIGCIMKTIIRTELNNQLKPSIIVDGKWIAGYNVDSLSFGDIAELEKELSKKKGFVGLDYSVNEYYNADRFADDEVLRRMYGYVSVTGLDEKYFSILQKETDEFDVSNEDGIINTILVQGKVKDFLPELKVGDDIEYYGTRFHIAGILSKVEYNQLADRKLHYYVGHASAYFTFFYLRDSEEPISCMEEIEKDAENIRYSGEDISIYIYVDLEEDDGSIAKYLSSKGYWVENDGIGFAGMKMVRNIIYFIVGIVLLIITINLINVRTTEILHRRKELKLLRNIGFCSKEVRKAVIAEGILVSICAVIIGFLVGTGAAYYISKMIYSGHGFTGLYNSDYMPIRFGIDWTVFLITAAVIFVINAVTGLIALAVVRKEYK